MMKLTNFMLNYLRCADGNQKMLDLLCVENEIAKSSVIKELYSVWQA